MWQIAKEDYRYSLFLAILLHCVLFLVVIVSLRHSTKLVAAKQSPSVIHATAISQDTLIQNTPLQTEKLTPSAKTPMSKPMLVEKSPVALPQAKIITKAHDKKIMPVKKESSRRRKTQLDKSKTHRSSSKTVNKTIAHQPDKKSLTGVKNKVRQLLAQEMQSVTQQQLAAAANAVTTNKYRELILQSIARQWIMPPEINKHLETRLVVYLAPGGMVLQVVITKSSGNPVLDRSAQTAVYKASPLPVPKNNLFTNFQQINLTVRPEGIMTQ